MQARFQSIFTEYPPCPRALGKVLETQKRKKFSPHTKVTRNPAKVGYCLYCLSSYKLAPAFTFFFF